MIDPTYAYHPAALLNPRGYNGQIVPNNVSQNNFYNYSGTTTPVDFTFDSPNHETLDIPMHNATYQPEQLNPPNGIGTMIERMNNVQDRMLPPPQLKRRKLESGSSSPQPGYGVGGGSSGIMGQHVKEKREEGYNQVAGTKYETVDLTEGSRSALPNVSRTFANSPRR